MITFEQVRDALTEHGYTFDFNGLIGYFKIAFGDSEANIDINPDGTLSFFLYRRNDDATDQDTAFRNDITAPLAPVGFRNTGAGADGCDCFFEPTDQAEPLDTENPNGPLNERGDTVEYHRLQGGGFMSLKATDGVAHTNGKSNVSYDSSGALSFFSDDLDAGFANGVITLIETLGFVDEGVGFDGSSHYFRPVEA